MIASKAARIADESNIDNEDIKVNVINKIAMTAEMGYYSYSFNSEDLPERLRIYLRRLGYEISYYEVGNIYEVSWD